MGKIIPKRQSQLKVDKKNTIEKEESAVECSLILDNKVKKTIRLQEKLPQKLISNIELIVYLIMTETKTGANFSLNI
ncbi:hypothetical protein CFY87_02585 [Actinobacillus seminis]|uniref:Uncharacterized protein n=1 Tax=Actinobacillus seminis TaxID=722 RepID=A0A263HF10_9PAST|nr:hypothetical protein [Actinobacillus seminis]OZN25509.1 hypothetical protein CFY87_02585 [Actinobacillus seminis]SUU37911.1 Uncharacterised protein [Actinobacillus seminis]